MTVLPRHRRLHPRSRVRSTIRSGRRVRSGCIMLHHLADEGSPQVAVVVGRGTGGSVTRHRRQRQARHVVAELWECIPPGALVVRVLPGTPAHDDLRRDLGRALGRL